ncbi:MAG: hypothetical protein ACREQK_14745 [Candidatus Binatia bacterium]
MAALGALGTPLLARAAVQGVELALLSAAIETCLKFVRGRRLSIHWRSGEILKSEPRRRWLMASKTRIYIVVLGIVGQLLFLEFLGAGPSQAGENAPRQDISLPISIPDQRQFSLLTVYPLLAGSRVIGSLAFYDDTATARPADYLELYDREGNLLVVSWFDRFGIERVAVDRGFLERAGRPAGIFVVLVEGDTV